MADTRILPAGDSGWLIELAERIDPTINTRAIEIARAIERAGLPVTDIVVGYRSVLVYVDPLASASASLEERLREIAAATPEGVSSAGNLVEVPACYDGEYGPDLADVA